MGLSKRKDGCYVEFRVIGDDKVLELLSNLVSELLITRRPDQAWLPRCHQYIECP